MIDVEKRAVLWEERFQGNSTLPMFSPDRRSISAPFQESRDRDAIAIFNVQTRARFDVRLPFRILFPASWIDDGAAFLVNRQDPISHIVLFDRFWEPDDR